MIRINLFQLRKVKQTLAPMEKVDWDRRLNLQLTFDAPRDGGLLPRLFYANTFIQRNVMVYIQPKLPNVFKALS